MFLFEKTDHHLEFPSQPPHWLPGIKPPKQEVELDRTHPLTRGMTLYALLDSGPVINMVTNLPSFFLPQNAHPAITTHGIGHSPQSLGTNLNWGEEQDYFLDSASDLTLTWQGMMGTGTGAISFFFCGSIFAISANTVGKAYFDPVTVSGTSTIQDDRVHIITGVLRNDGSAKIFVDGVEEGSVSAGTITVPLGTTASNLSSTAGTEDAIELFCMAHNRALSDSEIVRLHADPYQILKPR